MKPIESLLTDLDMVEHRLRVIYLKIQNRNAEQHKIKMPTSDIEDALHRVRMTIESLKVITAEDERPES